MAALIRILFSCCLGGRRKEDEIGERDPLLQPRDLNGTSEYQYGLPMPTPKDTADELNQKVANLVSDGTNRMIGPGRFNALYSSPSAQLSSSQAQLAGMSSSHPALNADIHHINSQQSSHSSFHPVYRPADSEAQPSEDSTSAIDASHVSLSLAQNDSSGPGTAGHGASGATAPGRPFQIHRGRPSSRKKAAENELGTRTQATGVLSAGEAADEQHNHRSEASPSRMDVDPPPPSSPPVQIRTAHGESASRERRQVHFKLPPPNELLVEFDS